MSDRANRARILREARDWLQAHRFSGDPDVVAFLRDQEVRDDVNRHYPGGWAAFDASERSAS